VAASVLVAIGFSNPAEAVVGVRQRYCGRRAGTLSYVSLHFVRRGSGPPLVLIPGTSSDHHIWDCVIGRLSAERDVIALDVPGFGASASLPADLRPDPPALARAIAELLDELGLDRPHVAGHSLGGAIALEVGRLGRAESVCALAPIGFWTPRESAWCARSIKTNVRFAKSVPDRLLRNAVTRTPLFAQVFARPWTIGPDETVTLAHMPQPDVLRVVDAYADYVVRAGNEIDCPITVAWGTWDALLFAREGRRVTRVLPKARMVWMPRLGHTLMWDDPAAATRVLLDASAG